MQTLENKVISKVYGHGRGWVFTPNEFCDLADPRSVGVALTELSRRGTIRRLARGLYDYPKTHSILGTLRPDPDAVAKALARKAGVRLQPSGAYAANLLGISEQVPAKITFLTDGASKKVQLDHQIINLKKTTPRNMATAGRITGLVIQALRSLGPEHVDTRVIETLRQKLAPADKRQLLKDIAYAPAWIRMHLRAIAAE